MAQGYKTCLGIKEYGHGDVRREIIQTDFIPKGKEIH
jgi:hypothetical protein